MDSIGPTLQCFVIEYNCFLEFLKKETIQYQRDLDTINLKYEIIEPESELGSLLERNLISLRALQNKLEKILSKIKRKEIRISMFGKVSVGKSMLLNAIFGMDLFVSMTAHSTSCFVQISQSNDESHYIEYGNNPRENLHDLRSLKTRVKELGSTMNSTQEGGHLATGETLKVWLGQVGVVSPPRLLQGGITEVVDTPGSGNKDETEQLLQSMSEDSDIFIFVVSNSLSDADRAFFDYQNDHSSRPDVFFLVNAWDQSDGDSEKATRKSRESIQRDGEQFIAANSERNSSEHPSERIAFISAREMLKYKLGQFAEGNMSDKQKRRKTDFDRFFNKLIDYVDNPEINKVRRHQEELAEMSCKLLNEIIEFMGNSCETQDISFDQRYTTMNQNISENLANIKQKFSSKKEKLLEKISAQFEYFETYYDIHNRQKLRDQIKKYLADLQSEIQTIQEGNEELIRKFKTDFQTTLGKHITQKVPKPKLADIFDQTVDFQIPETNTTRNIVSTVVSSLGQVTMFLPHPLFKILGGALLIGTVIVNKCIDNDVAKKSREDNKKHIRELRKLMESKVAQALDEMLEFVDKKLSSMGDLISEKHCLYSTYWRNVESEKSSMRHFVENYMLD